MRTTSRLRTASGLLTLAVLAASLASGAGTGAAQAVPVPPVFVTSTTTNLSIGDPIDVSWNATRGGEVPSEGVSNVSNYIGICNAEAQFFRFPYDDAQCEGIEFGADAFSGEVTLAAKRFIQTDFGVVDCMTIAYGCMVVYNLSYLDDDFGESVILHRESVPLTFPASVVTNDGESAAEIGAEVPVVAEGLPLDDVASRVGFVMMCALGDRGGLDLRCAPEVGTVNPLVFTTFAGTITMPGSIDVGGDTFDCATGRGCLVVLAIINRSLDVVFGSGAWIVATPAG